VKTLKRHTWTAEQDAFMREHYPNTSGSVIADALGLRLNQVYNRAQVLRIKKSDAWMATELERQAKRLAEVGNQTRFQEGNKAWNKGIKGLMIGGKATQFKKGNVPHTWRPIGHIKVDDDGYLKQKVTDDGLARFHYQFVHRMVWEASNGPIPKGHAVVFRNGDKSDVRLENLELIDRVELMRRNTIHQLPEDIRQTIRLKASLTRVINRIEKEHEEQNV
jgi:ribosomal protein L44E